MGAVTVRALEPRLGKWEARVDSALGGGPQLLRREEGVEGREVHGRWSPLQGTSLSPDSEAVSTTQGLAIPSSRTTFLRIRYKSRATFSVI